MPRTPTLPARIYSTPEYRQGYAAAASAVRAPEPPENPYFPEDLRHLGWADACYDRWSSRRGGRGRGPAGRPESRHPAVASAFPS